MPLFAVVFSSVITALGTSEAYFWAKFFLVLSAAAFTVNFVQYAGFSWVGAKLTTRLRDLSFRALLRQEIAFFDKEENSTGALAAKLSEDAGLVRGITAPFFGAILQAIAGVVAGLAIAFHACWQLAAVILGLIPVMATAGALQVDPLT
jgi:ATP-binding cassette subfamily B (MDR/TAP) protein 1